MNFRAIVVAVLVAAAGLVGLALFLSAGEGHTVYVPDEAARHREKGEFLLNKRRHTTDRTKKAELLAQAIGEFKAALKIKPDFAVAHNMLGHSYMEMGQWQLALKHLNEAIRLRPDYPAALFNRAQLRHRLSVTKRGQELLDQALADYRRALQSELAAGFSGDILKAMADAYRLKGDLDRAIETLREYLKKSPHAPDAALVERRIRGLELMRRSANANQQAAEAANPGAPASDSAP